MRSIELRLNRWMAGHALWLAALALVVSCHDAPRTAGSGGHQNAPQDVTLARDSSQQASHLVDLAKARETAVAAYLAKPSQQSGVALAHAYFPEFVATHTTEGVSSREASHALTVSPAGSAITLTTRGHVFRVASGVTPQWGSDAAVAGEGHFLAPVGRISGTATAGAEWKTSRLEEYWVRNEAAGEQRAEYDVALPASVRRLHQTADFVEFLDATGVAVLRFHPSIVRDAQGQTRTGKLQVSGATRMASNRFEAGAHVRLSTTVSLAGLRAPLVVDPGWSSTASLGTGRQAHTTTLLPNGKLLAVGGLGNADSLTSAELYDPRTDTWTAAASLSTKRYFHTATLLPSGKVLVTGGEQGNRSGIQSSSELYDPAADSWSAAASLHTGRYSHTATLLRSGQVLVAGGAAIISNVAQALSSAELYDSTTNTWSAAPDLATARQSHTATLMPSGAVLVAGGADVGNNDNDTPTVTSELYDPVQNTWQSAGSLAVPVYKQTATLLPSGQVLTVGGDAGGVAFPFAQLYDPTTKSWTMAAQLVSSGRFKHSATLLPSGKVLVVGGSSGGGSFNTVELYDPGTNAWSAAPNLATARANQTASLLPDGSVVLVGGSSDITGPAMTGGSSLTSTEVYAPDNSTSTSAADLSVAPVNHTATLLPSGKVLVVGGTTNNLSTFITTAELYDPSTDTWTSAASPSTARQYHTATLLPSGQVLVVGGVSSSNSGLASAELYDPRSDSWTAAASLATGRRNHTATLLASGQVLVVGGTSADTMTVYDSAELYDPPTNTWTSAGNMSTLRAVHAATLLDSGKVLVIGGYFDTFQPPLASAELYDPKTNTWSTSGSMAHARAWVTATPLPSGQVLVATGFGGGAAATLSSAELYNPVSGQWTPAASLSTGRFRQTQTLLPSGKVLVAGGVDSMFNDSASCELYDPRTDTWTTVASLHTARDTQVATLLPSGKVLITGGLMGTPSVELYSDTGAQNAWRPVVTPPATLTAGTTVTLSGTGFRGVSGASGGASNDSPTDFPFVSLQAIEGGQLFFLPGSNFSATGVTVTLPKLNGGQYIVSVTTNAISGGAVSSVVVPHTPPVAANGSASTTVGAAVPVNLVATAQNNAPLTYTVVTNPVKGTLSGTAPALTYTPNAGFAGPDSFTFKANDGIADSNVATVSLTVADKTPPTLALPETITKEATDATGATITFTATATDLIDGTVAVTCKPASGTHFVDGVTTVTCSAQDAATNEATGTFKVTVSRTAITAPTLVTPAADAKLADGLVAFSWTASTAPAGVTVSYALTITTAAGTTVTKTADGTSLTLTADAALTAGDYSWQVAAVDSRDNKGVSSPTGKFSVLPAPEVVKKKSGCGCSSSPSDSLANLGLYVLLGAAMLRSRRFARRA